MKWQRGYRRTLVSGGLAILALGGAGCELSGLCNPEYTVGEACAGVPSEAVCGEDACTEGVECASTVNVEDGAGLAEAASGAEAGTCIVLAPGKYPAVTVRGGVRLLGRGAEFVTVEGIAVGAGTGTVLRGMKVTSGGVALDGTESAKVESVLVEGALGSGIVLSNGASASVLRSMVSGAAGYGVDALGAGSLSISDSVIEGSGGPGVWVECEAGCECAEKPVVFLTRTVVLSASYMGVALSGVEGALTDVRISETSAVNFQYGGGLSVAACSNVSATGLSVMDNAAFGVLVHASSASLGQSGDGLGVSVSGNVRGIWAQSISGPEGQTVHLENASVSDNQGVGIGIGGETVGFIICKSKIDGTALHSMPVDVGGSEDVGDGILWTEGSQVTLEEVTVSHSARASVLIDGEVGSGSVLKNVTLLGGDAQKGIVQQDLPAGGVEPDKQGSVPVVQVTSSKTFAVALPPLVPASP